MTTDINVIAEATTKQALVEAHRKAQDWLQQHGDRDACGFAWVDIYGVRSNSKLGKALIANGFRKDSYRKSLCYWNPAQVGAQSVSALEAGANAFVQVFRNTFDDIRIYAGSRLD